MRGRIVRSLPLLALTGLVLLVSVAPVMTSSAKIGRNNDSPRVAAFGDHLFNITHLGVGYPFGIALNGTGHLYVSTYDYHQVQVFDKAGIYQYALGVALTSGADNAHFNYVWDIAVNATGHVYVVDNANHRVQVFDKAGIYKYTIGTSAVSGSDNAHFNAPTGVAVDSNTGKVYVVDGGTNHRVQVFDKAGIYQSTMGTSTVSGSDNAHFNQPFGVAVNGTGYVYVADMGNHRVQVFNSAGIYQHTIGVTGVSGSDNAHLNQPNYVGVNATGYVYVADTYNHRVQVFDSVWNYKGTIGKAKTGGCDNGVTDLPRGIAVNSTGYVYVADTGCSRVCVFDGNVPAGGSGNPNPDDIIPGSPILMLVLVAGFVTYYLARRTRRSLGI